MKEKGVNNISERIKSKRALLIFLCISWKSKFPCFTSISFSYPEFTLFSIIIFAKKAYTIEKIRIPIHSKT
jgi:hypothetical protein